MFEQAFKHIDEIAEPDAQSAKVVKKIRGLLR
jgi:hypothetical protein